MSHRAADAIRDHVRDVVVAEVEPLLLSHVYPAEDSQSWSGGTLPGITVALVRVTTTDGLHGIGETYLGNFAPDVHRALTRHFAPFVVGHDAADIDGFWTRCLSRNRYWARSGAPVTVLAAIESALLDVCGKAAAKPVHQLLGTAHEALPRYASGGMDADLTRLGVEQAGYRDAGFLGTKIRAGVDAHADVEKTLATIEAVGPDVRVAVDAVQGSNPRPWTAAQAIEVGRLLEPFDLLWFEEPCGAEDVEGHRACRDALTIPVAGGETRTTIAEFDAMISAGAVDVIQPDAAWCGIVPTVEVARRAERAGICLLYTSPSPRDLSTSRMPSSA